MIARLEQNPRLLLGIAVVAALLWVFLLLDLAERSDSLQAEEARTAQQLERMRSATREAEWPNFRDEINQRLTAFRERAWRAESEGLVQAMVQDWLSQQVGAVGATQRELAVSLPTALEGAEGSELPSEMRVVRARLVLDFQPGSFATLMEALATAPNWIWIESLHVRNWGNPAVELELGALFVIGPSAPA